MATIRGGFVGDAVPEHDQPPRRKSWPRLRSAAFWLAPPRLRSLIPSAEYGGRSALRRTDYRCSPPTSPNGRFFEGGWVNYGARLSLNANMSSHRYFAGCARLGSSVASFDVQTGVTTPRTIQQRVQGYSVFDTAARPGSRIQNVTLPIGAGSHTVPWASIWIISSTKLHEYLAGHLVRGAVNGTWRGFQLKAHWERQTQAPTAGYILAQVPWIQQALDQLGITASMPSSSPNFCTNATLAAYGYANNVTIDVTLVRTRFGLSGGWLGGGMARPHMCISTLTNWDALVDGYSHGAVHVLNYSRNVGAATELLLSGSLTCRDHPATSSLAILSHPLQSGDGSNERRCCCRAIGPRSLAPSSATIARKALRGGYASRPWRGDCPRRRATNIR